MSKSSDREKESVNETHSWNENGQKGEEWRMMRSNEANDIVEIFETLMSLNKKLKRYFNDTTAWGWVYEIASWFTSLVLRRKWVFSLRRSDSLSYEFSYSSNSRVQLKQNLTSLLVNRKSQIIFTRWITSKISLKRQSYLTTQTRTLSTSRSRFLSQHCLKHCFWDRARLVNFLWSQITMRACQQDNTCYHKLCSRRCSN